MNCNIKVIIAGGGTGGHLFPAITIGQNLEKLGANVKYMGSKFGIESEYFKVNDIKAILLTIEGLQRSISISSLKKNFLFPLRFFFSYMVARSFIKEFRPDIVVGTGGYSSGLPLLAAIHLNRKTLIQEQNSYPGLTTRKLASKVNLVCTGFESANKYLKTNTVFTGNPVRSDILIIDTKIAKNLFGLNQNQSVITILGGSQGSVPLNNHFKNNYKKYTNNNIQILWQCGKLNYEELKNKINDPQVHIFPFFDNIGEVYSASDIIISRAGALALSEMALFKKAMILIPLPHAAQNHQTLNAEKFVKLGAAKLVKQSELNSGKLEKIIIELFNGNNNDLKSMIKNTEMIRKPNAIKEIIHKIFEVANS